MQFQPTPALAVFLTLGAVPSGAGAQAPVVDSVACYTVHYDSARNGASPDLFPDHFVLLGRERGRVVPLDSTGFWRTPRSMADWYRHKGVLYIALEGTQNGARFALTPTADSLKGWAYYTTDASSGREKHMYTIGVRRPCHTVRGLPPHKRLKLAGGDRLKGSGALCPGGHGLSSNYLALAGESPAA